MVAGDRYPELLQCLVPGWMRRQVVMDNALTHDHHHPTRFGYAQPLPAALRPVLADSSRTQVEGLLRCEPSDKRQGVRGLELKGAKELLERARKGAEAD